MAEIQFCKYCKAEVTNLFERIKELGAALERIANYKEIDSDIQGIRGLVAIAEQALKGG